MTTFTRGIDPRAAMNIGTTTWDTLQTGNVLHVKKYVDIGATSNGQYVFARDRRPGVWGLSLPIGHYLHIKSITRAYRMRKGKNQLVNLSIEYTSFMALEDMRKFADNKWIKLMNIRGSFEQFENHFEIVQRTKL